MITINNLHYTYPSQKREVFSGLNLQLPAGRIYGLLGKNGSGKSTLLYLLSGLLTPKEGTIGVMGFTPSRREPQLLEEIYIVPEEYNLPDLHLDTYVKAIRPFYPRFSTEVMQSCLAEFELPDNPRLSQLSMGQKKKVLMSVALASGVRLLLMDEPTNGLDIPSKALFRQVVARHLQDDSSLIISTHQVHDVEALLDYVVLLDNSQVRLNAPMEAIAERYTFTTRQPSEMRGDELYSEPSLQGNAVVAPRHEGDPETGVDLELLFNAALRGLIDLNSNPTNTQQ